MMEGSEMTYPIFYFFILCRTKIIINKDGSVFILFLCFSDTKRPHTASVIVGVGETASFTVTYKPSAVQRSQGHIHLMVVDNQYEDSVIQLVGEGYQDDLTLENIHSVDSSSGEGNFEEGNMAEDDVAGGSGTLWIFNLILNWLKSRL